MRYSVVIPSLELYAKFDADDDNSTIELFEVNDLCPVDPTRLTREQRTTVLTAVGMELVSLGKVPEIVNAVINRLPDR
jgi:hypothetical protein